jgi:hypothetical protein
MEQFGTFFTEDLMTTVNHINNSDFITLLFAGRAYINALGGEQAFKDDLSKKAVKDKLAADALVDIMVKTPPYCYICFSYRIGRKNVTGIRFYYKVNHPAATKLYLYRKDSSDPLVRNRKKGCYVIIEYKRRPSPEFLAISAIPRKNYVDVFRGQDVDAYDGYHST